MPHRSQWTPKDHPTNNLPVYLRPNTVQPLIRHYNATTSPEERANHVDLHQRHASDALTRITESACLCRVGVLHLRLLMPPKVMLQTPASLLFEDVYDLGTPRRASIVLPSSGPFFERVVNVVSVCLCLSSLHDQSRKDNGNQSDGNNALCCARRNRKGFVITFLNSTLLFVPFCFLHRTGEIAQLSLRSIQSISQSQSAQCSKGRANMSNAGFTPLNSFLFVAERRR